LLPSKVKYPSGFQAGELDKAAWLFFPEVSYQMVGALEGVNVPLEVKVW
jgi:hypothetical protein